MKGRGLLAIAAAVVVAAFAAPSAFAATIRVDDDLSHCPTAAFNTIQAAVNAAAPGDTVLVCRGTYNESVTVDKSITLQGQRVPPDLTSCNGTRTPVTQNSHVTVNGQGGFAFFLTADNITLTRFLIQNTPAGPGVYTSPSFSGYRITENTIQDNVFGIYLHSNGGTQTLVKTNCFRENDTPGAAQGNAIYSDQGFSDGLIEQNRLFGHPEGGFTFHLLPTNDVTFRSNIGSDNSSFVEIRGGGTNIDIVSNIHKRAGIRDLLLDGGVTDSEIRSNIFRESMEYGFHFRNNIVGPNLNLTIESNIVEKAGSVAFNAEPNSLDNSLLKSNIGKATGGGPPDPQCDPTGTCGLVLGGGNFGNTFQGNIFRGTAWGCRSWAAAAMNTWNGNIGKPKNTPGTCTT